MNSPDSRKVVTSQSITQVATGLIIALAAFLAFALDKRELGPIYWTLVLLGVVLLVASIVVGGRAVARISSPGGLFNIQALTCLIGFVFLACSLFALGRPISNEMSDVVTRTAEAVGALNSRLEILGPSIRSNTSYVKRHDSSINQLDEEVKQLNVRLSKMEASQKANSKPTSMQERVHLTRAKK